MDVVTQVVRWFDGSILSLWTKVAKDTIVEENDLKLSLFIDLSTSSEYQ